MQDVRRHAGDAVDVIGAAQADRRATQTREGPKSYYKLAGKGETLNVVPRFLITGRRIAGSSFGGCKGREDVPAYVQRYLAGEIVVDSFVSHKLTLDEVNRGFELMEAGDGVRSVIDFA